MAAMVATAPLDLDSLVEWARRNDPEGPIGGYLLQLAELRELIERKCPDSVLWFVAYGPFLRLLDVDVPQSKLMKPIKLLAVTRIPDFFKATVLLSEEVLGPVFVKHGLFFDFDVWLVEDFLAASKKKSAEWRRAMQGVTLYGSPEAIVERA